MGVESLSIEEFRGSPEEWNAFAAGAEGGSFCHDHAWRTVMEDTLRHETHYWVARNADGRIVGALPSVRVKSPLFGDYLVSMPFLSYGGPIGSPEACRALAERATGKAGELRVDLLELRLRHELEGTELIRNARKLTVVKELPESSEELWEKGIKAKVRSQVRRPMKEGMTVRFGGDCLEAFYDVFSTTMRDLGTPVLPRRFFESIRTHFPESALFGIVELDGEAVACGCGFFWNGEFEITWAGSSREHSRKAPNMLLYWGFMEECVKQGAKAFNFGRCSPDSGTHRFKKQWGSVDEPLPWLQWSSTGVLSPPNPDSPKFKAATNVWRRLPVGVTNVVGPPVARLLP